MNEAGAREPAAARSTTGVTSAGRRARRRAMASCSHATPVLPMSEQRSASLTEEAVRLRERLLDVPWDVPPAAWYGRLAALALVAA